AHFTFHPSNYLRSFREFPAEGPIPAEEARATRHGYLACTSYIDALVGQVLQSLEETGERENTIVLFTSDHGYHLGDHGLWSKHTTFEIATRVPLLIAGPGIEREKGTTALVELVDLFPTLCDLAGLSKPDHLEGQSFASVLRAPSKPARTAAFSEFTRKGATGYSIRTADYRYTAWRRARDGRLLAEELYDHRSDPLETQNVSNEDSLVETVQEHRILLDKRLGEFQP
ncbi:MAG: sulfatase-like hydrolase/transferase, partial [Verrucomicrobiota bacterium]